MAVAACNTSYVYYAITYGPDISMQVMKNPPETYSGKIVRHVLRSVATKFESLKLGEEDPREDPYREELKQLAENYYMCDCYA